MRYSTIVSWYLFINKLNLKSNLPMFTYSILKNGVGYFYEIEDKTGIGYKEIPAHYCRVSHVDNGVYRCEVNIRRINTQDLPYLPKEFALRKDECDSEGWLQLSDKAFALPFNNNPYSTPVFATLFPNLYDIETNKSPSSSVGNAQCIILVLSSFISS